jgi:exosortase/archaeosortase family protein
MLDWIGIAAIQHGNVIETSAGLVGIDEACSGVRSLQSALMVSLFLGEHYRFLKWQRVVLVVTSLLLAFFFNVLRALTLTVIAATRGVHSLENWHDTAGFSILAATFAGLYGLSYLMRRGRKEELSPDSTVSAYPLPRALLPSLLVWLAVLGPLKTAWIEHYKPEVVDAPRWTINWPESNRTFSVDALPEGTIRSLNAVRGDSATWRTSDGFMWQAFFIRWEAGRGSAEAYLHTPEICLPAVGMKLKADYGMQDLKVGDINLPFHANSFEAGGHIIYVFRCQHNDKILAVDRDGKPASNPIYYFSRLKVESRDPIGRQVLQFAITGPESQQEALQALQKDIAPMIKRM